MKNYIFNRMQRAESMINHEIDFCVKYKKAKDVDYKKIRERVMVLMDIKSMPSRYKEQIGAILWFTFKREVSNKYLFPVLFEGKLYSKWDAMPEECRKMIMKAPAADLAHRPYPVFTWHFTEGMDAV